MKTQSFVITGMTCANCVMRVDKALNASDQILEASVNLATEKLKSSCKMTVMLKPLLRPSVKQAMARSSMTRPIVKIRLAKQRAEKTFSGPLSYLRF